jgi:hypothetical protein
MRNIGARRTNPPELQRGWHIRTACLSSAGPAYVRDGGPSLEHLLSVATLWLRLGPPDLSPGSPDRISAEWLATSGGGDPLSCCTLHPTAPPAKGKLSRHRGGPLSAELMASSSTC